MARIIYYTDEHDSRIQEITPKNIEGFKEFVYQVVEDNQAEGFPEKYIGKHKISEEVSLKDFFSEEMSPKYKIQMEDTVSEMLVSDWSEQHRKELWDMIETQPQFVEKALHLVRNDSERKYEFLLDELRARTIGDNIKLYNSITQKHIGGIYDLEGKSAPLNHLSEEQYQIISSWYEQSKNENENEKSIDKAYWQKMTRLYFQKLLESGILLNCDNLPTELRQEVNQKAIKAKDEKNNWSNLDSKFMDKDFLKGILRKEGISSSVFIMKKRKAAGLPKYYTSVHEAFMRELEASPKEDSSNKEIGQNKRFQKFLTELMGKDYKIKPNSILFDIYVQTAQQDILSGRAEELSSKAIYLVLAMDKNNEYKGKIPEEVLLKKNIRTESKTEKTTTEAKANKKDLSTVTTENIEDFKSFIFEIFQQNKAKSLPTKIVSPSFDVSENVTLNDFFSKDMTEDQKQAMYDVLTRHISENCTIKQRNELFEMMDVRPEFVAKVLNYAGNRHHSQYQLLIKGLQERPIIENIKLYDVLLKSGYRDFWHFDGRPQPVKHLTPEQKQIISGWKNLNGISHDKENVASAYIRELLETGILLNCDNLPPALRKQVNDYSLSSNWEKYSWKNLDSQFMDKEFLTKLFNKMDIEHPKNITSPTAKTQTEKNAEILPQYYTSVRDALLREVENTPKYDSSNYGREMSLNKKFQSIYQEIKGKLYIAGKNTDSVLFDVYRQTAQKDIIAGRAAELDAEALNAVLAVDKDNYYLRKIPSEVIKKAGINISNNQRDVYGISELDKMSEYNMAMFADNVATSKTLNRAEKDKVSKKLDTKIEDKTIQLTSEKKLFEERKQDINKLEELSEEYRKVYAAQKTIQDLQQSYGKILSHLKEGKANEQEKEIIDSQQGEKLIASVLEGGSEQMAYPKQKGLPLLFGRKEEQQRRQYLNHSIDEFNQSLKNVKANSEELRQYSGSLLSKETLEQASDKEQETKQTKEQMTQQINRKWQHSNIDEYTLRNTENDLQKMQEAKGKILKRKQQIQDLAKENMSVEGEALEDVSHLSGEDKHKVRAANKAKGKDKLAEKENIAKSGKDALSAARTKKLEDIKNQR